jgi:uncharacterized protein (DUF4213/DUF364 family)
MILTETINLLKDRFYGYIENLTITDVRVGVFMTAVRLSDGNVGVSGTLAPQNEEIHCRKEDRDFGDFIPNNMTEKNVLELLETSKKGSLIGSLKVATLNAISSGILENSDYTVLKKTDPIDLIDLNEPQTITIVGAFQSYIRRISPTKNRLFVLEMNKESLSKKHRKHYVPAHEFLNVLPVSDTVIITGQTLVNQTFENLLKAVKPGTRIIVTGPSSSFIPDVLFSKGVDIIGAVKATDPELMMKVVSEGGTGYHLFNYCAEKICIVNE